MTNAAAQGDVAGVAEEIRTQATGSLIVQLDDGQRAVLPRSYAETSTSLGYAVPTVFRSQGITVDHTFGLGGDSLYQEAGYTQLSRGRLSNNLYVAAPENPRWEIGHHADDLAQRDPLESLVGALSQNKEQTMARDRAPTWPPVAADDVASAYREHASLGRWIADHAPADVARQLADAYLRRLDALSGEHGRTEAEVDVRALAAAQRRRDAWMRGHQAEIERWSQLDRGLRRHEYRLGQAAAYSRPEHTAAVLGPLPERISRVERWQCAAGAIEAYRTRWSVATVDALGPEPFDPEQHAHWERAVAAIGEARFAAPGPPASGTDEAWLSSLWERVHALESVSTDSSLDVSSVPAPPQFRVGAATSDPDATSAATSSCDADPSRFRDGHPNRSRHTVPFVAEKTGRPMTAWNGSRRFTRPTDCYLKPPPVRVTEGRQAAEEDADMRARDPPLCYTPSLWSPHGPAPKIYAERPVATAIRLPTSLRDELLAAAAERDVSVNYLVTRAVTEYLSCLPAISAGDPYRPRARRRRSPERATS